MLSHTDIHYITHSFICKHTYTGKTVIHPTCIGVLMAALSAWLLRRGFLLLAFGSFRYLRSPNNSNLHAIHTPHYNTHTCPSWFSRIQISSPSPLSSAANLTPPGDQHTMPQESLTLHSQKFPYII